MRTQQAPISAVPSARDGDCGLTLRDSDRAGDTDAGPWECACGRVLWRSGGCASEARFLRRRRVFEACLWWRGGRFLPAPGRTPNACAAVARRNAAA
jgi:hypothetical protein